jgi:hypothetical protein
MLTILTDPVPLGVHAIPEKGRRLLRSIRDCIDPPRAHRNGINYRGHFAVTRSLIEGLAKVGLPHAYNPRSLGGVSDHVVVLAGVRTLRQAIELKRQGYIKRLFAGPNIVVFSSDADSVLASPEIDVVITPCDWVADLYLEDHPSLTGRCYSWPAGVDTEYWKPHCNTGRDQILIFEKTANSPVGPVEPYAEYLRGLGYRVSILRYGSYTHAEYLRELQKSNLMIGFATGESQGIAWAEAWSTDVPTLIWNNSSNVYRGRRFCCTTAPYLHPENGLSFTVIGEFRQKFAQWRENPNRFSPRAWTLANMSDEVCASMLYERIMTC